MRFRFYKRIILVRSQGLHTMLSDVNFFYPWSSRKGNEGKLLVSWGVVILLTAVFRFIADVFRAIFRIVLRLWGMLWGFVLSKKLQKTAQKDYASLQHDPKFDFMKFDAVTLPPDLASLPVRIRTIQKPDGSQVSEGEEICDVEFGAKKKGTIPAIGSGKIRWYVREGDRLQTGAFVYVLQK